MQYMDGDNGKDTDGKAAAAFEGLSGALSPLPFTSHAVEVFADVS